MLSAFDDMEIALLDRLDGRRIRARVRSRHAEKEPRVVRRFDRRARGEVRRRRSAGAENAA